MKVVIIGGVAGGASCATRLRRLDESAEIVILERGDNVSYANCGLPYYVGGRIEREESLTVASPGFLRARFNIDVRVRSEAVGIDTARKTVHVRERDGREYDEPYDKLLLAPGAAAKTFGWSGEGVFVLRDVADATGMAAYIREKGVKSALVAGGGFIGIETAENLAERGIAVTLAEFAPQVMPPLDPEMALLVRDELEKGGVKVMTGVGVGSVLSSADGVKVKFTDDGEGTFGMVVLALGVTPETALAKDAGIELTSLGGIKVGRHSTHVRPRHLRGGRRDGSHRRGRRRGSRAPCGSRQQAGEKCRGQYDGRARRKRRTRAGRERGAGLRAHRGVGGQERETAEKGGGGI